MTKCHPAFGQVASQKDVPPGKVINEQSPSRFQDPDAVVKPFPAPGDIISIRAAIVDMASVFFGQIERGIRENGIDGTIIDKRQNIQTIAFIKGSIAAGKDEPFFYSRGHDIIRCPRFESVE
jgi:hypothetical protein